MNEAAEAVTRALRGTPYDLLRLRASEHPLAQQFELISTAKVLIGSHGAGLSLTLLLPQDAGLLELLPGGHEMPNDLQSDRYSTQCGFTPYWYLSALRRLSYRALMLHGYGWDDSHRVPPEALEGALKGLLADAPEAMPTEDTHPERDEHARRATSRQHEDEASSAAAAAAAAAAAEEEGASPSGGGHTSPSTDPRHLPGCPAHTRWKEAPFANALHPSNPTSVFWLRQLFTSAEAASLTRLLTSAAFSTAADSTDHEPSYEAYLLGAGSPSVAEAAGDAARLDAVRALLLPRLESCVTPFVRQKFDCPECVACTSLVRRYRRDERSQVRPHRDALSRVTVVVELQPGDASSPEAAAAAGGLFVQKAEADAPSIVPMRAGDSFLHDYQLLHGVQLNCAHCTRYSLVVWFREDAASCAAGGDVPKATEMYRSSALQGVAEGRYSWARHAIQMDFDGRYAVRPNALPPNAHAGDVANVVQEVIALLEAAIAEQSHGNAAVFLAELNLEGVPGALQPDARLAEVDLHPTPPNPPPPDPPPPAPRPPSLA